MFRILILFLLAGMGLIGAGAEVITGTVSGDDGTPIEFANVIALDNDSAYVEGTVTDANGSFTIEVPAIAILKISAMGYSPVFLNVTTSGSPVSVNLKKSGVMLKEVTVTGNTPVTKLKGTSLVTTVSGTYLEKMASATEVIGTLPGVNYSNEQFSVFGKGTPVIYINGRQLHDNKELERLNPSDITTIEVIRNPGAQYSSETNAVIRLRTRRPKGEGWSVSVYEQNKWGHEYNPMGYIEGAYRKDGLEVFAEVNASHSELHMGLDGAKTYFGEEEKHEITKRNYVWNANTFSAKGGFNYIINTYHSLGAYYSQYRELTRRPMEHMAEVYVDGAHTETWNSSIYSRMAKCPVHNVNMYYNGKVGKLGIDFNANYYGSHSNNSSESREEGLDGYHRDVNTYSRNRSRMMAEKLILSYDFDLFKLHAGQEYTNSVRRLTFSNPEAVIPSSNDKIKEHSNAVFAEGSLRLFDFMDVTAGVRYEATDYAYMDNGEKNAEKSRDYRNWFPSGSLSFNIDNVGFGLSYNDRMRRPSYSQLDGTILYINNLMYSCGNPNLKPQRRRSIDLSVNYKWLLWQATYSVTKDPISFASVPYEKDPSVILSTYRNYGTHKNLSVLVNASPRFGIFRPQLTMGVEKQWFDIYFRDRLMSMNKPIWNVNLSTWVYLPHDFYIYGDVNFSSNGDSMNSFIYHSTILNLRFYKYMFNDALMIMLNLNDLLDQQHDKVRSYSNHVLIDNDNFFDARSVSISVRYSFNVTKSKYKGTGAGNSEKNRL